MQLLRDVARFGATCARCPKGKFARPLTTRSIHSSYKRSPSRPLPLPSNFNFPQAKNQFTLGRMATGPVLAGDGEPAPSKQPNHYWPSMSLTTCGTNSLWASGDAYGCAQRPPRKSEGCSSRGHRPEVARQPAAEEPSV